jgi:hypothetical protein
VNNGRKRLKDERRKGFRGVGANGCSPVFAQENIEYRTPNVEYRRQEKAGVKGPMGSRVKSEKREMV